MSLENLKLDADALGVPYRSDIKADTLQKKIDKHTGITRIPNTTNENQVTDTRQNYKNVTRNNIFTKVGRCSPNKIIRLTEDDAIKYAGLELCT